MVTIRSPYEKSVQDLLDKGTTKLMAKNKREIMQMIGNAQQYNSHTTTSSRDAYVHFFAHASQWLPEDPIMQELYERNCRKVINHNKFSITLL